MMLNSLFYKQNISFKSTKNVFSWIVCIALLGGCVRNIHAQTPVSINKIAKTLLVGQKQNSYLETAAASTDGGLLAVGYTEGYGWSGEDVLVVKLDAEGNRLFEKTIGTPLNDRAGAITDDRFGTIYIAGVGMDNNPDATKRKTQIWVKSLTDKGVFIAEKTIAETVGDAQINYIHCDNGILTLCGVENGNLKSWMVNTEGLALANVYQYKARSLNKLTVKKAVVKVVGQNIYIYGLGERYNEKGHGEPFVLKLNAEGICVADCSFPDLNAVAIGDFLITDKNILYLTGTEKKSSTTQEDVFLIKVDTSLSKSKSYFTETYPMRQFDEGTAIAAFDKENVVIFGSTKSHVLGSRTTNFLQLTCAQSDGKLIQKAEFAGDTYDDWCKTVVRLPNGALWLCGSKDKGSQVSRNMKFYFGLLQNPTMQTALAGLKNGDAQMSDVVFKNNALYAQTFNEAVFKIAPTAMEGDFKNYKISIATEPNVAALHIPTNIDLSGMKWQEWDLSIPIKVGEELEKETVVTITSRLITPSGEVISKVEKKVAIKPMAKAQLIVNQSVFKNTEGVSPVFKGEKTHLSIVIKNVGTATAEHLDLTLLATQAVAFLGDYHLKEAQIAVGQSKAYDFDFIPQEAIIGDSLALSFRVQQDVLTGDNAAFTSVILPIKTRLIQRKKEDRLKQLELTVTTPKNTPTDGHSAQSTPPQYKPEKTASTSSKIEETRSAPSMPQPSQPQPTKVQTSQATTKVTEQKQPQTPVNAPTSTPNSFGLMVNWTQDFRNTQITTGQEDYALSVVATSGKPLTDDNFFIVHNGEVKTVKGVKFDEIKLSSTAKTASKHNTYFDYKIKLKAGINHIAVKAKDGNLEDLTNEITVNYRAIDKGTLYVLSIGIPDKTGRLRYTQKDALDFAHLFAAQNGKKFGETQIVTLTTPDSTSARMISSQVNEFRKLAKSNILTSKDAIVLYISTHGIIGEDNALRLLSSDYSIDAQKFTSINFRDDIVAPLDGLDCPKYIFIDACKSGGIQTDLKNKAVLSEQTAVAQSFNSIFSKSSLFALTSCSPDEYSYEDADWQNGAFTKALKEILSDPSVCTRLDGKNGAKDHALSLEELFPQLKQRVADLVKGKRNERQTPVLVAFGKVGQGESAPFFGF